MVYLVVSEQWTECTEEKHGKLLSAYPVSQPRLEPNIS
jgi:hypothetical protein